MAEAIAISLSGKLAVALSRSAALGISRLIGVRSDIAAAKGDLDLLRTFLRFADSRRGSTGTEDELVAEWVRQVRDAAFELEDVADECSFLSVHRRFAKDLVNIKAWLAVSRRLRKARETLSHLSAIKGQYGIHPADAVDPAIVSGTAAALAVSAHFLEKEEIVGFAAHEKQLLEWVVEDAEPRRTLVAVCGMGGVGKTTLVTRVYREAAATSHFDCSAWVAVSGGVTRDDVLWKILKELHLQCDRDDDDYRSLVAAVRRHLGKRRYLIVLDDVWDAHLWDTLLRHAFLDDATGSRVVITTRSRDVAMAAVPERIMTLQPLPWHEAWTLFCNVAFRSWSREREEAASDTDGRRTCLSHLKELASSLLDRCGGLPLAIVSIANLLALKERTVFAWKNVHDSLVWDKSSSDLGIGEAASILNLSIDDLPHHLKRCFLSCSIYTEDFLIKRKILIRDWVAQGFIQEEQHGSAATRTVEDVADDYLDQLVHRSLIQVTETNEFGRAKRCLIHDLIRDLIIQRSRGEGFFQFTKRKITMDCSVRIRHLSVDRCELDCESLPRQVQASLRSFHAFGSEFGALFLSRFRLITVLNLWFVEMNKLPNTVMSLYNLRYLGIRSTLIQELPENLGNLQKLQTLDAKLSMVQRLPDSTAKLKSMRHLILLRRPTADLFGPPFPGKAVGAPKGLENLTSLQTLKYVVADKKMVGSLARLEQIRSLELSGVDASLTSELSSSISRMSCLVRLGLETEPTATEDAVLDLDSITPPPLKLQKLALTGKLARGRLPSWTCSLTSLVQLRLCRCAIAQDSFFLLAALPGLVNLSLIDTYHDKVMTFVGGSFPALKRLTLQDLANLSRIEFQQGCLLKLRDLVLDHCTELTEAPVGMKNLNHRLNSEVFGMPTEFADKLKEHSHDSDITNSEVDRRAHLCLRYLRWVGRNK
ncbi:unnamed protein product [Miscanthus lutarioriparius]|uniref:Uncharacterized protein n=1 Tax=Miscanthus lutarioriparius TaxID=422564 RepID=A0A811Q6H3_9POAL|nr:unnamed protein product [Miscanthus lutarioriparius]